MESSIRRGLGMNVHISYKISKTPDLEKLINQQVEKLGRYLQVFRPELVHLKGIVEESSTREGAVVSLNLRLPSGQMAAQESSVTATAAVKAAFDDVTEQLKKHKELLRSQHKWRRRRGPGDARRLGRSRLNRRWPQSGLRPFLPATSQATLMLTCHG